MRARRPIHYVGIGDDRGKWHAGSNTFRRAQYIGLDAGMIARPPLPCPAHTALDFVGHEQNAVPAANSLKLAQELGGSRHVATFALDGFDDDCGDFGGIHNLVKEFTLEKWSTLGAAGIPMLPV